MSAAALVLETNIAKYMYTLTVRIQNEIPRRRGRQNKISVISSYSRLYVEKICKKLIILSGITLNQRNHFAEGYIVCV